MSSSVNAISTSYAVQAGDGTVRLCRSLSLTEKKPGRRGERRASDADDPARPFDQAQSRTARGAKTDDGRTDNSKALGV